MLQRRFVFRFAMIYLCVLLPLMVVTMAITGRATRNVRDELTDRLSNNVKKVEMTLEKSYIKCRNEAITLFSNPEFQSAATMKNTKTALIAIRILSHIWNFNSVDTTLVVYYGGDNVFYHEGMASNHVFWKDTLHCTQSSYAFAAQVMQSNEEQITLLKTNTGDAYLFYHIPVGRDYQGNPRSLEVVSNSRDIAQVITEYIPEGDTVLRIQVGEEEIWFQNSTKGLQHVSAQSGREYVHTNKLISEVSNSSSTFRITVWYNAKQQLAEYYSLNHLCIILLSVGFVLSLGLSLMFSFGRVRQVKELAQNLSNKQVAKRDKQRSEFDYIQSLMNVPLTELSSMQQNNKLYRDLLRNQTARILFHGGISSQEEAVSMLKVCGVELFEEYFFLSGLRINSEADYRKLESLLFEDLYYVYPRENGFFVVLLQEIPCQDFSGKLRKQQVARLQGVLKSELIACQQIALSQVYDRVTKAGFAYYETVTILENAANGLGFICWEEWIRSVASIPSRVGAEYVNDFSTALIKRDIDGAMAQVSAIREQIQEQNAKEYVRYLLLNAIFQSCEDDEERAGLQNQMENLRLEDDHSFEKGIWEILTELFREPVKSFDQVLTYVEENFCSMNMSLDAISVYSGMSKSKLSKLFSARTGTRYLEYITGLRMRKAAMLLQNSDKNIRDIFAEVGYNDPVNASRIFKKIFQVTPTEYRRAAKEEIGDA